MYLGASMVSSSMLFENCILGLASYCTPVNFS